jgi:hypothetical protein
MSINTNYRYISVQRLLSTVHRIGQIESPARQLYVHFLTKYILTGKSIPGTTVHKIIQAGF